MKTPLAISSAFLFLVCSFDVSQAQVFPESGGRVVVEAETFSGREGAPTKDWLIVPGEAAGSPAQFSNHRGAGYIQALPDDDTGGGGGGVNNPPYVDYKLCISTPGTYRLFVRWDGHNDNSDTFFASVLELSDGPAGTIADWYRYVRITDDSNFATGPWFGSGGFERTDSPFSDGETAATWIISTPEIYTLRFSMREDGAAIDAFVLQLVSLDAPEGDGPLVSDPMNCAVSVEATSWGGLKATYRE